MKFKSIFQFFFSLLLCLCSHQLVAQFAQQGPKLIGSGATGLAGQGISVSLSADGTTALVSGHEDNSNTGAVWVYVRSGGNWLQQAKLVGTGTIGAAFLGASMSLSADGNTALVGGYGDNDFTGAAWVFTRSAGIWTQQGPKLVVSGVVEPSSIPGLGVGSSVALSADGNIAILGGPGFNNGRGGVWVFARSAGIWTQQGNVLSTPIVDHTGFGRALSLSGDGNTAIICGTGSSSSAPPGLDYRGAWVFTLSGGVWQGPVAKLLQTGAIGESNFGSSASLSYDGNTAIVSGFTDNGGIGATWVFTQSAGVWSQQGAKLVGTGALGNSNQGDGISLSADGNTAIIGSRNDNGGTGAAWVFTRSGGTWTQLGSKLVVTGAVGIAAAGSVSLSADGNTAMLGGYNDNNGVGAAWVFVKSFEPTVTSFTPATACINDEITITGTNFTGATEVKFGGIAAASFTVINSTTITAVIGTGSTGPVSITTPEGSANSIDEITVNNYTITASADANGDISSPGVTTVCSGSSKVYLIVTNSCYSIADVVVDGVSQGPVNFYHFTSIDANHTIHASFVLNGPYSITVTAGANGSISPGTGNTPCGSIVSYTITPASCYSIATLTVDGNPASLSTGTFATGGTYTFSNVKAPHTISATFIANPPLSTPGPLSGPIGVCSYIGTATQLTYSVPLVPGATAYTWVIPPTCTLVSQSMNSITITIGASFSGNSNKQIRVTALSACGNSPQAIFTLVGQLPAKPNNIDVLNTAGCPDRQYTYSIPVLPANATSLVWTVPAGGTIISGAGTTSITVAYSSSAVNADVTVQSFNPCGSSAVRSLKVKLPACPPVGRISNEQLKQLNESKSNTLSVQVSPNPTNTDFRLHVSAPGIEPCTIRILDLQGRFLEQLKMLPNETRSYGMELKPGIYLIEISQNKTMKTTKVIKY